MRQLIRNTEYISRVMVRWSQLTVAWACKLVYLITHSCTHTGETCGNGEETKASSGRQPSANVSGTFDVTLDDDDDDGWAHARINYDDDGRVSSFPHLGMTDIDAGTLYHTENRFSLQANFLYWKSIFT